MNYKNNMIVRKKLLETIKGYKNISYGLGISFGSLLKDGTSVNVNVNNGGIFGIGQTILYIINGVLIPLIFAISFITFLWGIYRHFISQGDSEDGQKKGRQLILYGLIGLAVMVSLWGLVNVVASTFGLVGQAAPPIPLSY